MQFPSTISYVAAALAMATAVIGENDNPAVGESTCRKDVKNGETNYAIRYQIKEVKPLADLEKTTVRLCNDVQDLPQVVGHGITKVSCGMLSLGNPGITVYNANEGDAASDLNHYMEGKFATGKYGTVNGFHC